MKNGKHKMPNGMMMKDSEMKKMMKSEMKEEKMEKKAKKTTKRK